MTVKKAELWVKLSSGRYVLEAKKPPPPPPGLTTYIKPGESRQVTAAWKTAADAASNAIWADEVLHDAKSLKSNHAVLYASLARLRSLGAIKLHTQGRQTSTRSALFTKGEPYERNMKADVSLLGLTFAKPQD